MGYTDFFFICCWILFANIGWGFRLNCFSRSHEYITPLFKSFNGSQVQSAKSTFLSHLKPSIIWPHVTFLCLSPTTFLTYPLFPKTCSILSYILCLNILFSSFGTRHNIQLSSTPIFWNSAFLLIPSSNYNLFSILGIAFFISISWNRMSHL